MHGGASGSFLFVSPALPGGTSENKRRSADVNSRQQADDGLARVCVSDVCWCFVCCRFVVVFFLFFGRCHTVDNFSDEGGTSRS